MRFSCPLWVDLSAKFAPVLGAFLQFALDGVRVVGPDLILVNCPNSWFSVSPLILFSPMSITNTSFQVVYHFEANVISSTWFVQKTAPLYHNFVKIYAELYKFRQNLPVPEQGS